MGDTQYTTDQFVRDVFHKRPKDDDTIEVFYCGHFEVGHALEPKSFRDSGHKLNEDRLFRELSVLNPADFETDTTTLDKLVRMQHHSLPTRLLDITSNPLVALYFACHAGDKKDTIVDGEVFVFKVQRKAVKFYDSDTASCIANLVRLSSKEREELRERGAGLHGDLGRDVFNDLDPAGRLLHFIKDEKAYFEPWIRPEHIFSVLCVKTKFNNTRIAYQVGASLLFGLDATLTGDGTPEIAIERMTIPAADKTLILDQLGTLNIKPSTVFPYIENSARDLSSRFGTGKRPDIP